MAQAIPHAIQKNFDQQIGGVSALNTTMQIELSALIGGRRPGAVFVLYEHAGQNCAAIDRLGAIVLMNHDDSLLFALVARLAERFLNLMRVNHSTSSDYSYAVGGYFVGSMPRWFVVRLGELD